MHPGEAAMKSGSRYAHFGTRSLSIPAGVDQSTVAEHLRRLREEPDALITLVEDSRGGDGDLYELVIPAPLAQRAGRQDWRGGKLHALWPVFLELGIPAALVYETLEHARGPLVGFELITASGLSRSAVYAALETLAAFNLAEQRAGRWSVVASTSLTALAEQFGVLESIRKTVQRHRDERAIYRRSPAHRGGQATPIPHPRQLASLAATRPPTARGRDCTGSARADLGRTPRSGVS